MWTTEQIIALAPDAASEKNGRTLAASAKWQNLGRSERAVWGECQGSGKNPYQTVIDLSEPAFKCSCPSRKFPCKHGLGLFLLFAAQENLFSSENPPAFCAEWLARRDARKDSKETVVERELTLEERSKREESRARRAEDRERKVAEGLSELDVWLRDFIRQGLVHARNQPANYWEKIERRMIDAQAPGIARLLGELSAAAVKSDNWAEEMLHLAGKIFLLIAAFKNLANLPESVRADVKSVVGFTIREDELESSEAFRDKWLVAGQRNFEEDRLRVQRTWLVGEVSGRNALLLDFAFQNQPFHTNLLTGTKIEAELIFYPGSFPLRAALKNRGGNLEFFTELPGFSSLREFLESYSQAAVRNLWIEVFPAAFAKVLPVIREERCYLRDVNDEILPVDRNLDELWPLIALSGGREVGIFGEWNGKKLFPLRAFAEGRMIIL